MSQSRDDTDFYLENEKTIFETLHAACPIFAFKDELPDKVRAHPFQSGGGACLCVGGDLGVWVWWVALMMQQTLVFLAALLL